MLVLQNTIWFGSSFNLFINEVKEKYKLRTTDKINNVIDKIDMVSKLINVIGDK